MHKPLIRLNKISGLDPQMFEIIFPRLDQFYRWLCFMYLYFTNDPSYYWLLNCRNRRKQRERRIKELRKNSDDTSPEFYAMKKKLFDQAKDEMGW
jgi:hypothetical protein